MSLMKMDVAEPVSLMIGGRERRFDIDDPVLPDWVGDAAFHCGGYPYDSKLDRDEYEETLQDLQEELVKLQYWLQATGCRIMMVFEGRDSAGKGGTIKRFTDYMNPRIAHIVALPKPTDRERGEWYYQRYVRHFPSTGEMRLFDRSWYNRAGVEPVMGFCTPEQHEHFLEETPRFEKMIVREGIYFFKFWLNIGREMQLKRFHDRRHDPLKIWKLSPMDIEALTRWDDYTRARNRMLEETHTAHAPWTVIKANDKRRTRINAIRHVLLSLDYDGRKENRIGAVDESILMPGDEFLASLAAE